MAEEEKTLQKKDTVVKLIALVALIALFVGIHLAAPNFYRKVFYLSSSGNMKAIIAFLQSYGGWGMLVAFLLDVLVNALGFLPSIFLSTANGLVFGLPMGVLISWTAESVGVIISFFIMRYFLRDYAEMVIAKSNSLKKLDEMSGENGLMAMTIARSMPYFPSGILTALGAVSSMSAKDYIIANFIGKFPSTALEVVVGHDAVHFREHLDRLSILITVVAIIYGYIIYKRRKEEKEER